MSYIIERKNRLWLKVIALVVIIAFVITQGPVPGYAFDKNTLRAPETGELEMERALLSEMPNERFIEHLQKREREGSVSANDVEEFQNRHLRDRLSNEQLVYYIGFLARQKVANTNPKAQELARKYYDEYSAGKAVGIVAAEKPEAAFENDLADVKSFLSGQKPITPENLNSGIELLNRVKRVAESDNRDAILAANGLLFEEFMGGYINALEAKLTAFEQSQAVEAPRAPPAAPHVEETSPLIRRVLELVSSRVKFGERLVEALSNGQKSVQVAYLKIQNFKGEFNDRGTALGIGHTLGDIAIPIVREELERAVNARIYADGPSFSIIFEGQAAGVDAESVLNDLLKEGSDFRRAVINRIKEELAKNKAFDRLSAEQKAKITDEIFNMYGGVSETSVPQALSADEAVAKADELYNHAESVAKLRQLTFASSYNNMMNRRLRRDLKNNDEAYFTELEKLFAKARAEKQSGVLKYSQEMDEQISDQKRVGFGIEYMSIYPEIAELYGADKIVGSLVSELDAALKRGNRVLADTLLAQIVNRMVTYSTDGGVVFSGNYYFKLMINNILAARPAQNWQGTFRIGGDEYGKLVWHAATQKLSIYRFDGNNIGATNRMWGVKIGNKVIDETLRIISQNTNPDRLSEELDAFFAGPVVEKGGINIQELPGMRERPLSLNNAEAEDIKKGLARLGINPELELDKYVRTINGKHELVRMLPVAVSYSLEDLSEISYGGKQRTIVARMSQADLNRIIRSAGERFDKKTNTVRMIVTPKVAIGYTEIDLRDIAEQAEQAGVKPEDALRELASRDVSVVQGRADTQAEVNKKLTKLREVLSSLGLGPAIERGIVKNNKNDKGEIIFNLEYIGKARPSAPLTYKALASFRETEPLTEEDEQIKNAVVTRIASNAVKSAAVPNFGFPALQDEISAFVESETIEPVMVVSDIHGNLGGLDALLGKADEVAKGEGVPYRVVAGGDHFDKGKNGLGVYKRLKELQQQDRLTALWGNHDLISVLMALGYFEPFSESAYYGTGFSLFLELGVIGKAKTDVVKFYARNPEFMKELSNKMMNSSLAMEVTKWMIQNLRIFHIDKNGSIYVHARLPAAPYQGLADPLKILAKLEEDLRVDLAAAIGEPDIEKRKAILARSGAVQYLIDVRNSPLESTGLEDTKEVAEVFNARLAREFYGHEIRQDGAIKDAEGRRFAMDFDLTHQGTNGGGMFLVSSRGVRSYRIKDNLAEEAVVDGKELVSATTNARRAMLAKMNRARRLAVAVKGAAQIAVAGKFLVDMLIKVTPSVAGVSTLFITTLGRMAAVFVLASANVSSSAVTIPAVTTTTLFLVSCAKEGKEEKTESDIQKNLNALETGDEKARLKAIVEFSNMKPADVKPGDVESFEKALWLMIWRVRRGDTQPPGKYYQGGGGEPSLANREKMIWALGEIGDPRALFSLSQVLDNRPQPGATKDPRAADSRAFAAVSIGELNYPDKVVRLWVLGLLDGNTGALNPKVEEETKVRAAAAEGSGYLGLDEVAPYLITVMNDKTEDSEVRLKTVWALGKLKYEQAIPELAERLNNTQDPKSPTDNLKIRQAAAIALGEMVDITAVNKLETLLDANKDPYPHVRTEIINSLGKIYNAAFEVNNAYIMDAVKDALNRIRGNSAIERDARIQAEQMYNETLSGNKVVVSIIVTPDVMLAASAESETEEAGLCVTGDTLLPVMPAEIPNPKLKLIVEVKPGDYVLSLNETTQQIEPHRINGLLDMGVKPVYRLTTQSGRSIKTTANHPYLVKKGWVKVSELKAGDSIAVPRELMVNGMVPLMLMGQGQNNSHNHDYGYNSKDIKQSLHYSSPSFSNNVAQTNNKIVVTNPPVVDNNLMPNSSFETIEPKIMMPTTNLPISNNVLDNSLDWFLFNFTSKNISYVTFFVNKVSELKAGDSIAVPRERALASPKGINEYALCVDENRDGREGLLKYQLQLPTMLPITLASSWDLNDARVDVTGGENDSDRFPTLLREKAHKLPKPIEQLEPLFQSPSLSLGRGQLINPTMNENIPTEKTPIFKAMSNSWKNPLIQPATIVSLNISKNAFEIISRRFLWNSMVGFLFIFSNKIYHSLCLLSSGFISEAHAAVSPETSILWDKITSIEYVGYEHVYDIEVEGTHNFIGNGIFAHNTAINPDFAIAKSATSDSEVAARPNSTKIWTILSRGMRSMPGIVSPKSRSDFWGRGIPNFAIAKFGIKGARQAGKVNIGTTLAIAGAVLGGLLVPLLGITPIGIAAGLAGTFGLLGLLAFGRSSKVRIPVVLLTAVLLFSGCANLANIFNAPDMDEQVEFTPELWDAMAQLENPDPAVAEKAKALLIVNKGDIVTPALVGVVTNPKKPIRVRINAAEVLQSGEEPLFIYSDVAALLETAMTERRGPQLVELILSAIRGAARLYPELAIPNLTVFTQDKNGGVRKEAIGALLGIGDKGILVLVNLLKNPDSEHRGDIIYAFGNIDADEHTFSILKKELRENPNEHTRAGLIKALGMRAYYLGSLEAVSALIDILKDGKETSDVIRLAAVDELHVVYISGSPNFRANILEALRNAVANNTFTRAQAEALGVLDQIKIAPAEATAMLPEAPAAEVKLGEAAAVTPQKAQAPASEENKTREERAGWLLRLLITIPVIFAILALISLRIRGFLKQRAVPAGYKDSEVRIKPDEGVNMEDEGGAMKRIGVRNLLDEDAIEIAKTAEAYWQEQAKDVTQTEVTDTRVTAKVIEDTRGLLPEGMFAYHFEHDGINIIIVNQKYKEEGAYHEAREIFWMNEGLTQHQAHQLASAEQVIKFGKEGLTPFHKAQLEYLAKTNPAKLQELINENREAHRVFIRERLGIEAQKFVEVYEEGLQTDATYLEMMSWVSENDRLELKERFASAEAALQTLEATKGTDSPEVQSIRKDLEKAKKDLNNTEVSRKELKERIARLEDTIRAEAAKERVGAELAEELPAEERFVTADEAIAVEAARLEEQVRAEQEALREAEERLVSAQRETNELQERLAQFEREEAEGRLTQEQRAAEETTIRERIAALAKEMAALEALLRERIATQERLANQQRELENRIRERVAELEREAERLTPEQEAERARIRERIAELAAAVAALELLARERIVTQEQLRAAEEQVRNAKERLLNEEQTLKERLAPLAAALAATVALLHERVIAHERVINQVAERMAQQEIAKERLEEAAREKERLEQEQREKERLERQQQERIKERIMPQEPQPPQQPPLKPRITGPGVGRDGIPTPSDTRPRIVPVPQPVGTGGVGGYVPIFLSPTYGTADIVGRPWSPRITYIEPTGAITPGGPPMVTMIPVLIPVTPPLPEPGVIAPAISVTPEKLIPSHELETAVSYDPYAKNLLGEEKPARAIRAALSDSAGGDTARFILMDGNTLIDEAGNLRALALKDALNAADKIKRPIVVINTDLTRTEDQTLELLGAKGLNNVAVVNFDLTKELKADDFKGAFVRVAQAMKLDSSKIELTTVVLQDNETYFGKIEGAIRVIVKVKYGLGALFAALVNDPRFYEALSKNYPVAAAELKAILTTHTDNPQEADYNFVVRYEPVSPQYFEELNKSNEAKKASVDVSK